MRMTFSLTKGHLQNSRDDEESSRSYGFVSLGIGVHFSAKYRQVLDKRSSDESYDL